MTNKGARLSRAQTVATRTHFVSPAGKRFAHHLIMEIQIQTKPQTRILTRIRMLKHHARLLCTTITTRQRMSKHIIITTRLRTHPAHLPMRRQWLLPNIFLPHSRTSLLETTIFPIIRNTDLILQTHLPKKIRRKSLRQVRNKRNQLWSPTVPAAAPSKASTPPLLLSSSSSKLPSHCAHRLPHRIAKPASPGPAACLPDHPDLAISFHKAAATIVTRQSINPSINQQS